VFVRAIKIRAGYVAANAHVVELGVASQTGFDVAKNNGEEVVSDGLEVADTKRKETNHVSTD